MHSGVLQILFVEQINHSARVTTEDHAYEIKGAAGLFSWDYLFSLRSPLSVKAGDQVISSLLQYNVPSSVLNEHVSTPRKLCTMTDVVCHIVFSIFRNLTTLRFCPCLWLHVPIFILQISLDNGDELLLQVFIQYDLRKSNAELALDYGFIEPNPDRNAYTLTLQISESDPFFGDKLDIAESNGYGESAYFDIVFDRPLPPGLLPYLRLVALGGTDAFLLESIFRNSIWGHLELPVSRDNEELICRVVQDACKSALAGYPTTIEEVCIWLCTLTRTFNQMGFHQSTCVSYKYPTMRITKMRF